MEQKIKRFIVRAVCVYMVTAILIPAYTYLLKEMENERAQMWWDRMVEYFNSL